MLNRNNLFLVALLVVQIVALVIVVATSAGSETRAVAAIARGISAEAVERITIADNTGAEITFARTDAGWVLPDADDFPVKGDKVDDILNNALSLDTRRLVASDPANFARLEVAEADFRRKLTLDAGGQSIVLYLGGSGGVDTVYTRRAGENEVYLGFGLNSWELAASIASWVDTSYVSVPQVDALEIIVTNAQGQFTFVRDGESWVYSELPDGAELEDTKLPSITRNATSVSLLEPLGLEARAEYGLDAPQVTVAVRYRVLVESEAAEAADAESADAETEAEEPVIEYSDESYSLILGAALDAGVVAKASAADYFVLVRETVLDAFKDLTHENFIRLPDPDAESPESAGE